MSLDFYNLVAKDINGNDVKLSSYSGKTILVVNTASECGFTKQYEELEMLYKDLSDKDFLVLGFPCNQFGGQEPGSDSEIGQFCQKNFGVTFPLFSKVDVNGDEAHELFVYLKEQAKGVLGTKGIKWNFTKFLISKTGEVVNRYSPQTTPLSLKSDIEKII
jgi:glutathione peroxidase